MLSPRRLVEKARNGIFYSIKADDHAASSSHVCTTMVADKGHFIAYTEDGARFMVPIAFLGSSLFQELLNASEDEFGFTGDRPITLPCNASFMQEVLSLLKRRVNKDAEIRLFLASLGSSHCSASVLSNAGCCQQQLLIP